MCDVLPTHENEPTEVLSLNKTGKVLTSAKKTTLLTKAKQLRKVTLFEQLCNLFFSFIHNSPLSISRTNRKRKET